MNTRCPDRKCKNIVHEFAFKKICTEKEYARYQDKLQKSLVRDNPHVKYCPGPGCTNVIRAESKNYNKTPVKCDCGFSFCFVCSDFEIGNHLPATCEQIRSWMKREIDEGENIQYIIANTKKCPNCGSNIEKNGGCMHMTCHKKAGGCGHEFCWLCRGDWSEHGSETGGYYNCNKYNESDAKKIDDQAAKVKKSYDEYLFYYHRYKSHSDAMKMSKKDIDNLESRIDLYTTKFKISATDFDFLRDAAALLVEVLINIIETNK